MRLQLEIDLDALAGEPAKEVGRILRYWGSSVTDELLTAGTSHDLYDSTYTRSVGTLRIHEQPGARTRTGS